MEVAKHGLRIGTDEDYVEVPLDGPTAMAAAELVGCTLPTRFISDAIFEAALEDGGNVHFVAAPEIAKALGIRWRNDKPDGQLQMSIQFIEKKNEILKEWRKNHNIRDDQLTAGDFKDIVYPAPNGDRGMLEIYGAHTDKSAPTNREKIENLKKKGLYVCGKRVCVQGFSGGRHALHYFDYSHSCRFVKPWVILGNKKISFEAFFSNNKYAREFGFTQRHILERAFDYPEDVANFVKAHKQD